MLDFYGQTDVGRRRARNEDSIYAHGNLFLVCDGMGGHQAGDVASRLAVEAIVEALTYSSAALDGDLAADANRLGIAIRRANRAVFRAASSASEYAGMGTTVAAVLAHPGRPDMTYANVGDSRVYLIRAGAILQLSRDDTWVDHWPEGGEPADRASLKHVLTKALGAREEVDLDVSHHAFADGDTVLLCSDGLTNMLPDRRILEIVSAKLGDPRAACAELVAGANAEGGPDNISVVLLHYRR